MQNAAAAFLLAHLSDPHLPPPPGAARLWPPKRLLARSSWRRRRGRMLAVVSDALAADIAAAGADHVALTGDLTSFGLAAEVEAGARWLARFGPPEAVSFVPGNHDALARGDWDRAAPILAPWATGDGGGAGFPWLRRRGDLALIGLSSAVPTPPLIAAGALGAAQIAAAGRLMAETRGLCRVLLIHHPPLEGVSPRKALRDRAALRAAIARAGAELVLHGHTHRAEIGRIGTCDGPALVLGCPSAAMRAGGAEAPAAWRALRIEREAGGWRVEARERVVGLDGAMADRARLVFRLERAAPPG